MLAEHALSLGYTHVQLLPIMEHPFYGSWGYQTTGYFAASSRYGTPQDLMYLIDHLHQRGIGVLLDWVPSHFPSDEHGLAFFDGTHLYEHADPREGFHPEFGARPLQRTIQRLVENELSRMVLGGQVQPGDRVAVDVVEGDLHFEVEGGVGEADVTAPDPESLPAR